MKALTVKPKKNSLKEIKTWNGRGGKLLTSITEYRDGVFKVYFPESAGEKAQMLEELWSDPAGKSYPPLITEKSQNIDLSDYSHEMMSLGAASIRWEIQKGGKDISSKNAELLDSLQRMSDEEVDMFLEDNSWEIDLQYYLIESVASVA
jgi:hypothetical protein